MYLAPSRISGLELCSLVLAYFCTATHNLSPLKPDYLIELNIVMTKSLPVHYYMNYVSILRVCVGNMYLIPLNLTRFLFSALPTG